MAQQDVNTSPSLSAGPCCHLIPPDGRAVLLVVPASDAELHTSGSCHADAQSNRLFIRFLNLIARKILQDRHETVGHAELYLSIHQGLV